MTLARIFILRAPEHAQALLAFIKANAGALAAQGTPLQVRVNVFKQKRSNEQNALMWVRLAQIAEHAWIGGKSFSADAWHEHLKRELLPEETAAGVKKWAELPRGGRELAMSTTDLNVSEFGDYLTAIEAYAASELGVTLA